MCLLNNVSHGFHISGVCSDVCSFNRILCRIWMLLTRFDRDVIDSAVNSTAFFTVSPSAVYNGVAWSRQIQIQINLRWALFVTYTIIQSIMRSEMCSLHLTHPSGAVGSRHSSTRGAVGGSVPCSRVSPQSWTLPARAGIRTNNLGLPRVSSPTLYPLGHDCPPSSPWFRSEQINGLRRIAQTSSADLFRFRFVCPM